MKIKRALLSVSDKAGLVELAKELVDLGVELLSTGGTASALAAAGLPVTAVSDVTKFPEMLEGRVKTLHPAIHGGLLADRSKPEHMAKIAEHGIEPIDLVVINLYPFAATIARPDVTRELAIENIDIGGPSMVRSAAKNHASVTVVTSPDDYPALIDELHRNGGETSEALRRELAAKAYAHTGAYDALIASYLRRDQTGFPQILPLAFTKVQDLRYGENPHQKAAFYREDGFTQPGVATAKKLHGKELSFNNIFDINGAYELGQDFAQEEQPFAAIIKHTNPCGAALAPTLDEAFKRARAGDPISAFGGILALTRPIDVATAEAITAPNTFFEAIIAPGYEPEAFTMLTTKKKWGANLILLETPNREKPIESEWDLKRVTGGLLVQSLDVKAIDRATLDVPTRRGATEEELNDLIFAWKVVKHIKSNAIAIAKGGQLYGVGAGQMNRVGSVRLAVAQAGANAQGAALASDAFFPFSDGPQAAGEAGITSIIQPGGSVKDAESIAMADQYNIAMVLTGARHFRH
ncbi:MAG: bifunctional phosphoribosylaminoimidazolecarboxamide formyltransferase/IMP cyclohydrolase [Capsulimonadaceae bacterium]|nr:bifunctional phosphoribosylaminoimidazolecarboxamide formyltransferase/IMP cyclohydrolase [Capsulimonadaceae bacterium]